MASGAIATAVENGDDISGKAYRSCYFFSGIQNDRFVFVTPGHE
jgi:hypothetical protein